MGSVISIDPRTNREIEEVAEETLPEQLDDICRASAAAASVLADLSPSERADLLDAMASGLEGARESLVPLADRESALGITRLEGELTRTINQLRLFAEVLREGSFLEAIIDSSDTTDLRRMLVPLGPVGVFGASNFPFAFSAAGGDTASALGAGCPVVVKAHGAHPALDAAVVRTLRGAAERYGITPDVVTIVFGRPAAQALVRHPIIQAVGFTGSEAAGRMLMDLAAARPQPIPVYAEMGSLNPLIISPEATNRTGIADTVTDSILLGSGQFCTKPGVVLIPSGDRGDHIAASIADKLRSAGPMFLLSADIRDSFVMNASAVAAAGGALTRVDPRSGEGSAVTPALVEVTADEVSPESDLLVECFGPGALIVRYSSPAELSGALDAVPPSLTVSLFAQSGERDVIDSVIHLAERKTGRIIFNGVSTGVAVTWSQNHGGPYPASAGGMFTSVGATALRRFQRPIAYQSFPADLLPEALRDENPLHIPRRVNGVLEAFQS